MIVVAVDLCIGDIDFVVVAGIVEVAEIGYSKNFCMKDFSNNHNFDSIIDLDRISFD